MKDNEEEDEEEYDVKSYDTNEVLDINKLPQEPNQDMFDKSDVINVTNDTYDIKLNYIYCMMDVLKTKITNEKKF